MGFGQIEQTLAGAERVPRRFHPHVLVPDVAGVLACGEVAMPLELGRHVLYADAVGDERRRHRRGRRTHKVRNSRRTPLRKWATWP